MESQYNLRSPAVKRLMREAKELKDPNELYHAQPLEDNLFEWHFTFRGPSDSDFDTGIYHGRILFPPEYPMKPPSIMLLTPNGRFETNKKICLSISGYHPETWLPSWSIRTALLAIIGFMPTHPHGAIGSLDYSSPERKALAKQSKCWKCPICEVENKNVLPEPTEASLSLNEEAKRLAAQIEMKGDAKSASSETEQSSAEESQREQTVATNPVPQPQEPALRRRVDVAIPRPPPRRTETFNHHAMADEDRDGSFSLVCIILLGVALAALVLRRIYMISFDSSRIGDVDL